MLNLLANSTQGGVNGFTESAASFTGGSSSTLQEIPSSYLFQRLISRPRTSFLTAGNGGQGGGH
jgi:hypothetical protein